MKKILALILAMLMLVSLIACDSRDAADTNGETDSDTESSGDTEQVTPTALKIGGTDISEFKIVYAENPMKATYDKYSSLVTQDTEYDKQTAEYLAERLKEKFGVELEVIKDTATKTAHEINIGDTNRGMKSKISGSLVSDKDYVIREDGGSLLLCGKTYGATWHSVDGFIELCMSQNKETAEISAGYSTSGKANMLVVGCIGDSLTNGSKPSGYTSKVDDSIRRDIVAYPAVLQRIMWKTMSVYNYGLGGRTMTENFVWQDGSGNHAWNACQYYQPCMNNAANIDLVLLMLGTNDSNKDRAEATGYKFGSAYKAKFIESCGNIVNDLKAKNENVTVLLLNCPYSIHSFEANMNRYIRKYQAAAAEQLGLTLIDMYEYTKNNTVPADYPDGLHPNDEGYTKYAVGINELISPTVEELLSAK